MISALSARILARCAVGTSAGDVWNTPSKPSRDDSTTRRYSSTVLKWALKARACEVESVPGRAGSTFAPVCLGKRFPRFWPWPQGPDLAFQTVQAPNGLRYGGGSGLLCLPRLRQRPLRNTHDFAQQAAQVALQAVPAFLEAIENIALDPRRIGIEQAFKK